MNTAHDLLTSIARDGEQRFAASPLAGSHARVVRRVRTARLARAGVGTAASVGLAAAAGWGAVEWHAQGLTIPAQPAASTRMPTAAPSASPTTAPTVPPQLGHRVRDRVTIVPGSTVARTAQLLAEAYDADTADGVQAIYDAANALAEPSDFGEGWVMDGTFDLTPYDTLPDAANALVEARIAQLEELGVPRDDWHDVLTAASLVEKESKLDADRPKVARVIANRLAAGMPLELESTVRYGSDSQEVFVTDADKAIDTPYNTYVHTGLPRGPIAIPSAGAIDAVLHPAEGDWLYFVTTNLRTGETVFSVTEEEHLAAVQELNDWIVANTEG